MKKEQKAFLLKYHYTDIDGIERYNVIADLTDIR